MRYRRLGKSGPAVSEIGFGTWGVGGTQRGSIAYGPTDDRESIRALYRAFERGVTFYDTADLYGRGHSEELLGRVFAGLRDRVVLATKAGFLDADGAQDFSPARLIAALDGSLERLRTDHVDLFQLHSPPAGLLREDPLILECLETVRRSGRARSVGVSVCSPADGLVVARDFAVDCLQVNFNLADQRAAENGLFAHCAEKGIGVIVRTPLCFGFLTGAFGDQTAFEEGDHRGRWPPEQRRRWDDAARVFADCLSSHEGQTPAQLALRFCLSYPGVSTVIPGMLTAKHVEENVRASDLGPLASDEMMRIEELYRQQTFFLSKQAS